MQSGIERSRTAVTRRKPSPRSDSVVGQAQMRAPAPARRSSSSSLACVAWMIVVASRQAARVGEELDRAAAVLLEALLDLAWLLVGVDVQRQLLARGVPADLLEPRARAGADGVGGDADGDSGGAERLDLVEVGGDGGLAHAIETAALVGDVEQHDRDPGLRGRLGRRERLRCTEVVELADGGVSRRAHLAVHLGRSRLRPTSGVARSASSSIPSRHVQKSVPAARPRSARWNAWLWLLTKPGSEKGAVTTADATTPGRAVAGPVLLVQAWDRAPSPHPCGRSRTR